MRHLSIAALLAAILLIGSSFAVGAQAETYLIGDADGDGEITILDATKVQRVLADLDKDDGAIAQRASMVDDELNIMDATVIQRYLADLECGYPVGQTGTVTYTEPTLPSGDEYEMPILK